ncbi:MULTISPECIES: TniQ family protein [unclassified Methylobacterium]|uniref:TniQ family protein n=1 Tax=unclassified Methylobacterium TaxID=2615210 RepID=UPI001FCCFBDC|nr:MULTISPECIES: TniQ family protein [unclassified Methylobacterium]
MRVRHLADEPAYDLFRRLGTAMGQPRPSKFAAELGLNWSAIKAGKMTPTIAELAGVDQQQLAAATFERRGELTTFRSTAFRNQEWQSSIRACPRCVEEDRFVSHSNTGIHRRSWWDLRVIERCPKHGNALVDGCTDCGCTIIDSGRGICLCGKDLISETQAADERLWEWDKYYISRLLGRPHPPVPLLDPLRFVSLAPAVLALAGLQRPEEKPMATLASIGFGFALQDDLAIESAMAVRAPFDKGRDQINTFLDPLHSLLKGNDDLGHGPLLALVRRFARTHLPVTATTKLLGAGYENVDFADKHQTQREIGIDRHILIKLYRELVDPEARALPTALHNHDVGRIRKEFEACLLYSEARRRLGIRPNIFAMLIEIPDGVLPRARWSYSERPYVKLQDVVALESAAVSNAPFITKLSRSMMPMQDFWKTGLPYDKLIDKGALLNALLTSLKQQRISPVARLANSAGLGSLVFSREEISDLIALTIDY